MNALAETTAASPVITEYYQTLLVETQEPYKSELVSLVYLLIGTCGVSEQKAVYLCADRACRVFVPKALREAGLVDDAEELEQLKAIVCKETADYAADYAATAASNAAYAAYAASNAAATAAYASANAAYASARSAAWSAVNAANAAYATARSARFAAHAAYRSGCWSEAIQLFKDLCALPRERYGEEEVHQQ